MLHSMAQNESLGKILNVRFGSIADIGQRCNIRLRNLQFSGRSGFSRDRYKGVILVLVTGQICFQVQLETNILTRFQMSSNDRYRPEADIQSLYLSAVNGAKRVR